MSLTRGLLLSLIIANLLGGFAAYMATELSLINTPYGARIVAWGAFGLITLVSASLIAGLWWVRKRSLRNVKEQLEQLDTRKKIGMIMVDSSDELSELVSSLNNYLTGINAETARKNRHYKELELQADVAETERRHVEAVIFSITEAVIVTDRYDELLLANCAAERLFDFAQEPWYRRPVSEVIKNREFLELLRGACRGDSPRVERELEYEDRVSGRILTLRITLSSVLSSHGENLGVVAVINDYTNEKEISRMKDEFISLVSHEFKTPLASIRAYAEMISDGEVENEKVRCSFGEIIQKESVRLNRLIDNILDISRIESGTQVIRPDNVNVSHIGREVVQAMNSVALDKRITIRVDTSEEVCAEVDSDMIHHAVTNLVGNAVKYSPAESTVTLNVYAGSADTVVIEVGDEGPGIAADMQSRIFEKFYRADEHRQLAQGSGLGLHLVKQIVESLHQGEIRLSSSPGRGSTFTIILPVHQSREVAEETEPALVVGNKI